MSQTSIRSYRNKYLDSVKLLAASRALLDTPGIQWGTVVTGTPANIEVLIEEGFDSATLSGLTANDLVMAARGGDADRAFSNAEQMMFNAKPAAESANEQFSIRSLTETMGLAKPPNLAVISVGGAYAALEAHKAIGASMDVLLFSDNVALDDEIELKRRAAERSLFLMGPGAGTAMIDGVGLGFANVVRGGSIGVVAAAGTGAQEVMSLIDRAGLGVSQVIGVGGRDLSEEVGGVMTELAIQSFEDDPKTEAILVVSKPP
ncbi:MAG TPA: protein FdrA, partial [Actinobacteria bacterium]|nr:protein FdrA [Actinomycetota bacterium]